MSLNAKQIILFGSPGTGKSRHIKEVYLDKLDIDQEGADYKRVVFHPEYTYGDFMGKLMPLTKNRQVEYNFYPGQFMKALARAYRQLLDAGKEGEQEEGEPQNVALVIDEINRGNSAAIFGSVFQLLDRSVEEDDEGWSEYRVQLSKMEFSALKREVGIHRRVETEDGREVGDPIFEVGKEKYGSEQEILDALNVEDRHIKIPPNLYLLASMNTSDNSIYHMDAAFKRRWAWQYMDVDGELIPKSGGEEVAFKSRSAWENFADNINNFIEHHHKYVRRVEDKRIGHWFLIGDGKDENAKFYKYEIQNKVMFFLWDSVFTTSKKPLAEDLFDVDESDLVTFGSFAEKVDPFIEKMKAWQPQGSSN